MECYSNWQETDFENQRSLEVGDGGSNPLHSAIKNLYNERGFNILQEPVSRVNKDKYFESMIKAGRQFKKALNLSDKDVYQLLKKKKTN